MADNDKMRKLHNRLALKVTQIVTKAIVDAGGGTIELLIVTESIAAGLMFSALDRKKVSVDVMNLFVEEFSAELKSRLAAAILAAQKK